MARRRPELVHRIVMRADTASAAAWLVNDLAEDIIEFSAYARVKDALHQATRALPPRRGST
jgi:hypothetical protein